MKTIEEHEAYEVVDGGGPGALLVTCEHASMRLPLPWTWPEADRRLVGTHWSFDLGIADLTRELAADLGCVAVLSRFTRLLVDPNRPLDAPTLFRTLADGEPVALNADLDDDERERRIEGYWRPYHDAVERYLVESPDADVLGMHSFTPVYEGQERDVEIGVLFDADEDLAVRICDLLRAAGYRAQLNEPWSGRDGLMYAPQHHATLHRRRAVELEVRQDLCERPEWRRVFRPTFARVLAEVGLTSA